MEAKQFKSLIKEAVREAVREELGLMLLEQLKSGTTPQNQPLTEGRSMSFDSGDVHSVGMRSQMGNKMAEMFGMPAGTAVKPQTQLKVDPTSDNPFAAFINDTAANLSPQEMRQMLQGG